MLFSVVAVLLLGVEGSQAQKGIGCCAPNFQATGYSPTESGPATVTYDKSTGNRLARSTLNGLELTVLLSASDSRVYTRYNQSCVYEENAFLRFSAKICVRNESIYDGEVVLDGETFYSWRQAAPNVSTLVVVDENCIPKVAQISTQIGSDLFAVIFNAVQIADASEANTFNTTGCFERPS